MIHRCLLIALAAALLGCPAEPDPFVRTCFMDWDGDGYGYPDGFDAGGDCGAEAGEVRNGDDCNDSLPSVHPLAEEIPGDWLDQDCNGSDAVLCRRDGDGDGFGADPEILVPSGNCADDSAFPIWQYEDCNDQDAAIYPFAIDLLGDDTDMDCSEDPDTVHCFRDLDGDLYGSAWISGDADYPCTNDEEVSQGEDCNDFDAAIHPGAVELANDFVDQDCNGSEDITCWEDADGDGYGNEDAETDPRPNGNCSEEGVVPVYGTPDCDDTDADIHPGAWDMPGDGVDQDCVNGDDPGEPPEDTCFQDNDHDGFGSTTAVPHDDCSDLGYSDVSGDCDDSDASRYPGAEEVIGDNIDQDCDGAELYTCYEDADHDGYGGQIEHEVEGGNCPAEGWVWGNTDCNDYDAAISPAAYDPPADGVDQNCNGVDSISCYYDGDGDGYGWGWPITDVDGNCTDPFQSGNESDCNDYVGTVHPGAVEVLDDGIDQDCSGADTVSCYPDGDGDGYGYDPLAPSPPSPPAPLPTADLIQADGDCVEPGLAETEDDCVDSDPSIHPGAAETGSDGVDQDCDGVDGVWCYADLDNDGFGAGPGYVDPDGICSATGQSANDQDCNNTDSTINPAAVEIANDGIDQNCSGADTVECFQDADGDGHGIGMPVPQASGVCTPPLAELGDDCDDNDPLISPDAYDDPNTDPLDEDCSGSNAVWCYTDADHDGFGTGLGNAEPAGTCAASGDSANNTDCDDATNVTYPGAPETPGDGIDSNCDGQDDT